MQKARYYGLLTLLCLCLYLPGIASLPLFDRDEPHFSQASKQMLESQNYWQIHFQSSPRHLKPPGIYWLQSTAVRLFSSTESLATWPYRLPSVLGAWLAVLLTFGFACRITSVKTAAVSATLLACSILLMVEAHLAVTDAVLLVTMVAMQFALGQIYWNYRRYQQISWLWPGVFWLAMALGVFIKGTTPLVGGLTILGLVICDRKQKEWLPALRWREGILLLLILTAVWLIPFSLASKSNFLWDMIRGDALPKIAGGQQSHGMFPGYLTLIFTATFWPGSLFIVPAGIWAWRQRQDLIMRFLLAWIIPCWIFFEIIPTKLPEYLLPVYPAVALLIALFLNESQKIILKNWQKIFGILQQILWIAGTLLLAFALTYAGYWGRLAAGLLICGVICLLYIYYRPPLYRFAAIGVIVAASAAIPIWEGVLPNLSSIWITPRLYELIQSRPEPIATDEHPLLAVDYQEPSLVFMLGTHKVLMTPLVDAIIMSSSLPDGGSEGGEERSDLPLHSEHKTAGVPFWTRTARPQAEEQDVPSQLALPMRRIKTRRPPPMNDANSWLLVSQQSLPCFNELMAEESLIWRSVGSVQGLQYNGWRHLNIYLLQISGTTHESKTMHQTNFLAAMARHRDHELLFCGPVFSSLRSPAGLETNVASHYFSPDYATRQRRHLP